MLEKDDNLVRMYEKKSEAKFFSEKRIKADLEVRQRASNSETIDDHLDGNAIQG